MEAFLLPFLPSLEAMSHWDLGSRGLLWLLLASVGVSLYSLFLRTPISPQWCSPRSFFSPDTWIFVITPSNSKRNAQRADLTRLGQVSIPCHLPGTFSSGYWDGA